MVAFVVLVTAQTTSPPASAEPPTAQPGPVAGWAPKTPPLTTAWTNKVSAGNPLPEYPRPALTRARWQNLNGVWQFAADAGPDAAGEAPPVGRDLAERILVPYPVESALSGIKRPVGRMWYRRTFTVPDVWQVGRGARLLLHFQAVDYEATVYVNGRLTATHKGGFDAFGIDVTDALTGSGPQEVVVGVHDQTDAANQAVGKQRPDPGGIFYTSSSGIWQTVWMEPVAPAHVDRLDATPDLPGNDLRLTVVATGVIGVTAEAIAYAGEQEIGRVSGPPGTELRLPVPNPHLWTPDDPFLYTLKVRLSEAGNSVGGTSSGTHGAGSDGDGGNVAGNDPVGTGAAGGDAVGNNAIGNNAVDEVSSYFGMRSISLGGGRDGRTRMLLNGRFVMQVGTLDQGFWPDGLYTAPTDEALRSDLEAHKQLGFNMVRKHAKVESDRWYYWADKLGLLVWQDMPAMFGGHAPPDGARYQFESELHALVDAHRGHPSIVMWVPFNEGWGEYEPKRVADLVRSWDSSRLVDADSGVNCCASIPDSGEGDVYDNHTYVGPGGPVQQGNRASVDGEFGGLGLKVDGHLYDPAKAFANELEPDAATVTRRYVELSDRLLAMEKRCGLSGSVYTQISDVENEINGLYTYDRAVLKADAASVRKANRSLIDASVSVEDDLISYPPGTAGLDGVSFYRFDEGNGTVTRDALGGHEATLVGGPAWTGGHSGSAPAFNGSNQFVDTGTSIVDTTGNYSVSAWVKIDRLGSFATAVSQDGDPNSAFYLQYSAVDNRFAFSDAGVRALGPTPVVGQWYHLTGVRDAAGGTMTLYVDGAKAGVASVCLGEKAAGHTVIGRATYNGRPVDFWPGTVDEVHIFDRALSAAEVGALYSAGSAAPSQAVQR
nr:MULTISPECIES: LamG-like jellyroll fold domain-containing protein [unclassified Frankia]